MNSFKFLAGAIFSVAVMGEGAKAAPIKYEVSGYGTGVLDGDTFLNAFVRVDFYSDTNSIAPNGVPYFVNKIGTGTITVTGVGTDTILNAYAYATQSINGGAAAGIATGPDGASVLATVNKLVFSTYELGPIAPTLGDSYIRPDYTFSTASGGTLRFRSFDATSTFSATLTNVPLPASAPMFGAALVTLGAVGYGMKRKKAAAA